MQDTDTTHGNNVEEIEKNIVNVEDNTGDIELEELRKTLIAEHEDGNKYRLEGSLYFNLALKSNEDKTDTIPSQVTGEILTNIWFDATKLKSIESLRYILKDVCFVNILFNDELGEDMIKYTFYCSGMKIKYIS